MLVSDIELIENNQTCELRANIKCDTHWVWGDEPFSLFYRFPLSHLPFLSVENGDPFFAALLIPAMRLGEPLHIPAPVSHCLLRSGRKIQTMLTAWDPSLSLIEVVASARRATPPQSATPPISGLFFSLGVDSSYSLFKHSKRSIDGNDPIDELITIEGFDIYLWESERFPPLLNAIREIAKIMNHTVLPVTTNLRELSDRIVDWVRLYHGAALASVPLALGRRFRDVYIAASQTYQRLVPRGTHPLLDPLWSTETLAFHHDGLEAGRLQKMQYIAEATDLIKRLRVCATSELTSAYNCGRCEKCLRTMIGLHIAGVLDQCETLPHEIDPDDVRLMQASSSTVREYLSELYQALPDAGEAGQIKAALAESLSLWQFSLAG